MDKKTNIFTITRTFPMFEELCCKFILYNHNGNAVEPQITDFYRNYTRDTLNEQIKSTRLPSDSNSNNRIEPHCKPFHLTNIWLLFIVLLPISGVMIGFLFRHQCPLQSYIPLWEIVNGSLTILFLILIFITKQISIGHSTMINSPQQEQSIFRQLIERIHHRNWAILLIDQLKILSMFFLVIWFICGNIWVYKNYTIVKYDPSSHSIIANRNLFCHKICYLHAFWYMTTVYILLGFCFIFLLLSIFCRCIRRRRKTA